MTAALRVLFATAALSGHGALAQIFSFENVPVPVNNSLYTLYMFYVYSLPDAPETSEGEPFVRYHNFSAKSMSPLHTSLEMEKYNGLQMSIMQYKHFGELIDEKHFCCTESDVQAKQCKRKDELLVQKPIDKSMGDADVFISTVKFAGNVADIPSDTKMTVLRTGVYILVFSNCGDYSNATVSGSVVVKNSYGFLPGNEYHKMPFYGWLLLIYIAISAAWMGLSLRRSGELHVFQHCITAAVYLGLVEALAWWIFYNNWNTTGFRGSIVFAIALIASVVKSIFSYISVLVASLGWGVTRKDLDARVMEKIQVVVLVYVVLGLLREYVLSFRHSQGLTLTFLLLSLLPVALLNSGIFYWVFTALSGLIETLEERRQTEKLTLFTRLWTVLIGAFAFATFALLMQIFDLLGSITLIWKYQWVFVDGVWHVLFLAVLASMMFLWAPHGASRYFQQIDDLEADKEGESCLASTKARPSLGIAGPSTTSGRTADVIGALEVDSLVI